MVYSDEWGSDDNEFLVKDCNGTVLNDGDSVIAIKDLKVKGGKDIKRGDKFKNIILIDSLVEVECGNMVLKTEFFKKA